LLPTVARPSACGVGGLRPRDALEDEVDRRSLRERLELGGDVREHAGLHRDLPPPAELVQHLEQPADAGGTVPGGIDPDDRVAAAEQEAVQDARADASWVIGGMVRLEPRREPAPQANRRAKASHHPAAARH
jgi:hypothetical protein